MSKKKLGGAEYQRQRRAAAREQGYCPSHVKVPVSPGNQYCDDCLAAGQNRRTKPAKGRPPSFLNAQEGYEAPLKLAKKPATTGNCALRGCPKKPAFEGVDYCQAHGLAYAKGLR